MPEKDYGLKPTPEMRSFAEQMLHLGADNYVFTAAALGAKSPAGMDQLEKTSEKTKAVVTKNVSGNCVVVGNPAVEKRKNSIVPVTDLSS